MAGEAGLLFLEGSFLFGRFGGAQYRTRFPRARGFDARFLHAGEEPERRLSVVRAPWSDPWCSGAGNTAYTSRWIKKSTQPRSQSRSGLAGTPVNADSSNSRAAASASAAAACCAQRMLPASSMI